MDIITVRLLSIVVLIVFSLTVRIHLCTADETKSASNNYKSLNNFFVKKIENGSKETQAEDSTTTTTTDSTTTTTIATNSTTPATTTTTTSRTSTTTSRTSTTTTTTPNSTDYPPEPPIKKCPTEVIDDHIYPESDTGSWAIPTDIICLNDDYTPVRRQCLSTGTWNLTKIECSKVDIKSTTYELFNMLDDNSTTALNSTNQIIEKNLEELEIIDIHFISNILAKAGRDDSTAFQPKKFVETISNIMKIPRNKLRASQEVLNSTDTMLYSLDQLLLNSRNTNLTVPKLFIHTINTSDKICGAMIKSTQNKNDFNSFELEYLYNNYEDELNKTNFEIAFFIPSDFTTNQDHYFITIFYNDYLFNQKKSVGTVGSWIISILFPDVVTDTGATIQIFFKEFQNNLHQKCQHWKYGIENNIAITGEWNSDGNAAKLKDGYFICEVNHTTHFGMLVSGSVPANFVLDLITIFGSVLSVIGISIIFVTDLIFKQWRNKANNKIILNVSLCLLLLIISFIISDRVDKGPFCIIVGILLHYTVLAQFCWALTISYSSYRRFHLVSNNHIQHVVMKFCIFSWGIPLIIVIIIAAIDVQTYDKKSDKNSSQVCYPKDIYLKLGVLLPMAIILTINFIIYFFIAKNLFVTKLDIRKHESKKSCSIQKSIILLFFMMGMTWIFGFFVAFTDNVVFLYLFCTTATSHGFVIFIFYILDSAEVKQQWEYVMKRIVPKNLRRKRDYKDRQRSKLEENTTESVAESTPNSSN